MLHRQFDRSQSWAWQWLAIFALVTVLAAGLNTLSPTPAWSADEAAEEPAASEPAAEEEPAADDTATAADAAAEEEEEEAAEETGGERSFLTWLIEASGWFGAVLLFLSFVMVALIMMSIMQVRRDTLLPQSFLDQFDQKLGARDYQGAYQLARDDESMVARVLAAGLAKLNRGYSEAVEAMQEVGEDENMQMEQRLSYLALIGSIAPMIGLMGTVYGMIMSFEKIAQSATSPKPSELAEGISTALFTTLEGLTVAIPALIFYSFLRNRVARYVLEVGMASEGLMNRFSTVGKQQAQQQQQQQRPAGGAPAAPQG